MNRTKTMMQHLLLVLGGMICATNASAYDFSAQNEDGVTIYYTVDGTNAKVSNNLSTKYSGVVNIPQEVSNDGVTYTVTAIGQFAFGNCIDLTEVGIPASVTHIERAAFGSCSSLRSISLPENLAVIEGLAFSQSALQSVTIPATVRAIGDLAFSGCENLSTVVSEITSPFTILSNTFYGINKSATLYVPQGTKAAYEATNGWTDYFSNVVETPDANTPVLTVGDISLNPGKKAEITFSLANGDTPIIAYQFDIALPEGIALTNFDEGHGGKINYDRCTDFTGMISATPTDGVYTIESHSQNNQPMSGSEGVILTLRMLADENLSLGTYKGTLSNIKLVKDDNTKILLEDITFDIIVKKSILKGDVNGDGVVNVEDVTEIAEFIVHKTNTINAEAADMDEDGVIDVADITLVVKVILEKGESRRLVASVPVSSDVLKLQAMGNGNYAIALANNEAYTASQFDIKLPAGCTISDMQKTARCQDHSLGYERIADDAYRVIIYSLHNDSYTGNDGPLLTFRTDCISGDLNLENTLFVNANHGKATAVNVQIISGINDVTIPNHNNVWHNLQGIRLESQPTGKGVYLHQGKKVYVK